MLDPALATPSSALSATSLGYVAATVTPDEPLPSATSKGKHKTHVSASTANKKLIVARLPMDSEVVADASCFQMLSSFSL